MSKAVFQFQIQFDPADTWTNAYQLDADFAEFLKTKGLQAEILTPLGNTTTRILEVTKIPEMPPVPEPNPSTPVSPGNVLKKMAQQQGFDGKYRKNG